MQSSGSWSSPPRPTGKRRTCAFIPGGWRPCPHVLLPTLFLASQHPAEAPPRPTRRSTRTPDRQPDRPAGRIEGFESSVAALGQVQQGPRRPHRRHAGAGDDQARLGLAGHLPGRHRRAGRDQPRRHRFRARPDRERGAQLHVVPEEERAQAVSAIRRWRPRRPCAPRSGSSTAASPPPSRPTRSRTCWRSTASSPSRRTSSTSR